MKLQLILAKAKTIEKFLGKDFKVACDSKFLKNLQNFTFEGFKITNFEMETSAIFGLSKLLGHQACSMNAILANRANGTFSKSTEKTIDALIQYTLDKLIDR